MTKERTYFRQEPCNLYENFVEAYHFPNQTKDETKKQFIKRANKCWKEMKESDIQIRELLAKHAKAKKSPGQEALLSIVCFTKATLIFQ